LAEAVAALEHYLREAEGQVPTSQLQQVDAQVKEKRSQIAALMIRTNVSGARVLIDDRVAGQTPIAEPLFVMPGAHSLRVLAPGKQELARSLTLAPGESLDLDLTLRDVTAPAPAPPGIETSGRLPLSGRRVRRPRHCSISSQSIYSLLSTRTEWRASS